MGRSSIASTIVNSVVSLGTFHRIAGFWGFYLIVFYCLIRIMLMLETLLLPFLWAFFVCMALYPFVDLTEDLMVFSWTFMGSCCRGDGYKNSVAEAWDVADQPRDEMGERFDRRFKYVRYLAALVVLLGTFGSLFLFGYLVYQNAHTVFEKKDIYKKGFERFGRLLATFIEDMHIPIIPQESIDSIRSGVFLDLEKLSTSLISFMVLDGPNVIVGLVLTLIYMIFWLFGPMPLDPSVRSVFQRYILLKSMVSAAYAVSVFALLFLLDVDLRAVFALLTFILNFVPEVGAIMCIALPLPIILFDGRNPNPMKKALMVLIGECALKLIFGNVVEVIVLESDFQMRMHPVVILLCIAFFGWTWGPTGMLLSVPIMAAFKALVATSAIPDQYRDPILVMMEGDSAAPKRWDDKPAEQSVGISPFVQARKSIVSTSRASRVEDSMARDGMMRSRRSMTRQREDASSAAQKSNTLSVEHRLPKDFNTRRVQSMEEIKRALQEREEVDASSQPLLLTSEDEGVSPPVMT
eukprot:GEMP01032207.1.p1 GENE.GEMP01032207.1~~GEMP01032207.1.p1  ORF type:complete len:522 (+),score=79.10 GEMP01032207.1:53-1618(+)